MNENLGCVCVCVCMYVSVWECVFVCIEIHKCINIYILAYNVEILGKVSVGKFISVGNFSSLTHYTWNFGIPNWLKNI